MRIANAKSAEALASRGKIIVRYAAGIARII